MSQSRGKLAATEFESISPFVKYLQQSEVSRQISENVDPNVGYWKDVRSGQIGASTRIFNQVPSYTRIQPLIRDGLVECLRNNEISPWQNVVLNVALHDLFDSQGNLRQDVYNELNSHQHCLEELAKAIGNKFLSEQSYDEPALTTLVNNRLKSSILSAYLVSIVGEDLTERVGAYVRQLDEVFLQSKGIEDGDITRLDIEDIEKVPTTTFSRLQNELANIELANSRLSEKIAEGITQMQIDEDFKSTAFRAFYIEHFLKHEDQTLEKTLDETKEDIRDAANAILQALRKAQLSEQKPELYEAILNEIKQIAEFASFGPNLESFFKLQDQLEDDHPIKNAMDLFAFRVKLTSFAKDLEFVKDFIKEQGHLILNAIKKINVNESSDPEMLKKLIRIVEDTSNSSGDYVTNVARYFKNMAAISQQAKEIDAELGMTFVTILTNTVVNLLDNYLSKRNNSPIKRQGEIILPLVGALDTNVLLQSEDNLILLAECYLQTSALITAADRNPQIEDYLALTAKMKEIDANLAKEMDVLAFQVAMESLNKASRRMDSNPEEELKLAADRLLLNIIAERIVQNPAPNIGIRELTGILRQAFEIFYERNNEQKVKAYLELADSIKERDSDLSDAMKNYIINIKLLPAAHQKYPHLTEWLNSNPSVVLGLENKAELKEVLQSSHDLIATSTTADPLPAVNRYNTAMQQFKETYKEDKSAIKLANSLDNEVKNYKSSGQRFKEGFASFGNWCSRHKPLLVFLGGLALTGLAIGLLPVTGGASAVLAIPGIAAVGGLLTGATVGLSAFGAAAVVLAAAGPVLAGIAAGLTKGVSAIWQRFHRKPTVTPAPVVAAVVEPARPGAEDNEAGLVGPGSRRSSVVSLSSSMGSVPPLDTPSASGSLGSAPSGSVGQPSLSRRGSTSGMFQGLEVDAKSFVANPNSFGVPIAPPFTPAGSASPQQGQGVQKTVSASSNPEGAPSSQGAEQELPASSPRVMRRGSSSGGSST